MNNELAADIGYKSINHHGEQLCGDHVDIVTQQGCESKIVVLADGLRSGVKASILSTLTAKIIATMMANGLPIEECVRTIAATLPISSEYGVAYSTFTIVVCNEDDTVDIMQYENPPVLLLRNGESVDFELKPIEIDDKTIYYSKVELQAGDVLLLMSDGCPGANTEISYNKNWDVPQIADFVGTMATIGYSAKNLASMLVDECYKLYGGQPIDDTTACVIRAMQRLPVNVLFGPPRNRDDVDRMLSLFFSKAGKRVTCGGTTSQIAADYLGEKVRVSDKYKSKNGPPMSEINGIDLVTEGIVTMSQVLKNAKDYIASDEDYVEWSVAHDASSLVSRLLFEEATDINFFVGRAINPAHQDMGEFSFNFKMQIVEELAECLKAMGKNVRISYF